MIFNMKSIDIKRLPRNGGHLGNYSFLKFNLSHAFSMLCINQLLPEYVEEEKKHNEF